MNRIEPISVTTCPEQGQACPHCGTDGAGRIRKKSKSNGTHLIGVQCSQCGRLLSQWFKHGAYSEFAEPWNEQRASEYWEEKRAQSATERAAKDREWWISYSEYLRTPAWRSKRALKLQRSGGMCEGCGIRHATQAHHLTYAHVKNEFLWELVAICDECHARYHEKTEAP